MDGRHLSLRKRLGLELYRRLHREAVERHELRTLFWECTLRCNLRCGHCGSDCTASPDSQDMPAATVGWTPAWRTCRWLIF